MNIALFGGNFDPVHKGHLTVGETILKSMPIDQVWFVPAGKHPQKPNSMFTFEDRIMLLKEAVKDNPKFFVYEYDTGDTSKSFTIYLIQKLREQYPTYNFSFVIGADNVANLQTWHRYDELLDMIDFIVIDRDTPDKQLWGTLPYFHKLKFLEMPLVNISSSEIRKNQNNFN